MGNATRNNNLGKRSLQHCFCVMLLLAMLLPVGVWGQTDYSGVYYVGSRGYVEANTTTNYYLCPTEGWAFYVATNGVQADDNGQPFLTTYQCRNGSYDATKAVWIVEREPNSGCYYIKQALTGRYMVSNGTLTGAGPRRARVHLETVADATALASLGDLALFEITYDNDHYDIVPHSTEGRNGDSEIYLVVNNNNKPTLAGESSKKDGPTGFKNCGGIIGLYTHPDDGNAKFYLEPATVAPPTITNNFDGTFTITAATGATIYYTTDGNTPTTSTPTYGTTSVIVNQTENMTVIKAIAKASSDNFPSWVTTYNVPKYTTPTITFNSISMEATITCTDATNIYYTTDGYDPTTSSSPYTTPLSIASTTTVKAIATHAGYLSSNVAEFTITQVTTPTIQNNGDNAVSITCATEDATIYYTTDGTTPTTSSNLYSGPLQDNISGVTIKAIAVKENMINSEIGSGMVTLQCDSPVIAHHGNTGFSVTCPFPASGVVIYYTTDGSAPTTSSSSTTSGSIVSSALPVTVKAFAAATGYNNSDVAIVTLTPGLNGYGTSIDPYTIESEGDLTYFYFYANNPAEAAKHYRVTNSDSLDFSTVGTITLPFCGSFDGGTCILTGLTHPLFETVDGGVVKNVTLKNVAINSSEDTLGAIASVVKG